LSFHNHTSPCQCAQGEGLVISAQETLDLKGALLLTQTQLLPNSRRRIAEE
jgi:hypothetical protein